MSDVGEAFKQSGALEEIEVNCPFDYEIHEFDLKPEDYDKGDDHGESHEPGPPTAKNLPFGIKYKIQKSTGGTLGANLKDGSPGGTKTWNDKHEIANPEKRSRLTFRDDPRTGMERSVEFLYKQKRVDTSPIAKEEDSLDPAGEVLLNKVDEQGKLVFEVDGKTPVKAHYPYSVAAHHLIPGNATLAKSPLYRFMTKSGATLQDTEQGKAPTDDDGNKFEIAGNIGYNVNGSHNGVWLPGNYAMNEGENPEGSPAWSTMTAKAKKDAKDQEAQRREWCRDYILAVVARAPAQFHDSHTKYNEAVEVNLLSQFTAVLKNHLNVCTVCKEKMKEGLPPPYRLIPALFKTSAFLRGYLTGDPENWKQDYVASDQFSKGKMPLKDFDDWLEKAQRLYAQATEKYASLKK